MAKDQENPIMSTDAAKQFRPSKFELEFVNVGAFSPAEKQRNQRLVRSTAMKSFRRRQLSERSVQKENYSDNSTKAKTRQSKPKTSPKLKQQLYSPDLRSESSSEASLGASKSDERRADYFAFVDEIRRSGSGSSQNSRATSVVTSPVSPLGTGRVDPFRLVPNESSSHINELIDHCVTRLWPGLRPRRSNSTASSITAAWLEKLYERPVVMHALLFGASVHLDILRSPRLSLDNPIRLHHKIQTMRLLKEELKSPAKTPVDEVLLAILCLASNEVETFASEVNSLRGEMKSPFNSPLRSVQWLDVYGSIVHIEAHTTAMRSLVERRGGLELITLEGLADVLSFSDILGATQRLSKPYWPLLARTKTSKLETPNGARKLGRGFQDILSLRIHDNAASVLQDMAELTVLIDNHCRGNQFIPDIAVLIDHRNTIQHNLLSLPRGSEMAPSEMCDSALYDAIRLAAIIYSAAVTFPLPSLTGIFGKSSAALRTVIEESELDPAQQCPKVLLWILVLGGIAATATPDRAWYVKRLAAVSVALNLCQWDGVVEEMENWLWLESACDAGGWLLYCESEIVNQGSKLLHGT